MKSPGASTGGIGEAGAAVGCIGEAGAGPGCVARMGGKLGGIMTGCVVEGMTMASMTSVRASDGGTSGGGAGVVAAPASSIMPIRPSTPSADGSSAEEGTNRMFVSTTGVPSCDSLRFLMLPILYSRSTKVGLGRHIPGRKGPYRDLVYTRGSIGSVDAEHCYRVV